MKRLLACIIFIGLVSCTKNYDNTNQQDKIVLPAYTETGANTFGFMLDNDVWTVFGKHFYRGELGSSWINNTLDVSAFYQDVQHPDHLSVVGGGRMSIIKNSSAVSDIQAGFNLTPLPPYIKNYFLTNDPLNNFSVVDIVNNKYYKTDSLHPVILSLNKFDKIDSLTRICSGRFSGVLYNEADAGDSIVITDGRLDTKIIFP